MHRPAEQPASAPVFEKCVQCGYSLKGLPANHACPECGLRFDERCELYRVTNPKKVLVVWAMVFAGGWMSLRELPHLRTWASATLWDKLGASVAVIWIGCLGVGIWYLYRLYRRGQEVAITTDGLFVRMMTRGDGLIPWNGVAGASIKPQSKPQARVASVSLRDKRKTINVGGLYNLFPTQEHLERFVRQVNERVRAAESDVPYLHANHQQR